MSPERACKMPISTPPTPAPLLGQRAERGTAPKLSAWRRRRQQRRAAGFAAKVSHPLSSSVLQAAKVAALVMVATEPFPLGVLSLSSLLPQTSES